VEHNPYQTPKTDLNIASDKRPKSITVISWLLIVLALISLVVSTVTLNMPMTKALMAKSPVPLSIQYIMLYAGLLTTVICGAFMLKGKNWARLLYTTWGLVSFIFSLATTPVKATLIPSLVVFAIILFFLFRPRANEYFKQTEKK